MSTNPRMQHLACLKPLDTAISTRTDTLMKLFHHLLITIAVASKSVYAALETRKTRANRVAAERGSVTLEQIIWTVAIAVVALAIVAIVVAAINSKAAELPL